MDKEFLVERENFQVTKEKIIKTNELLHLYQGKTERLAKANQAFKQLKIKHQNLFQESHRLKMDNERLNDSVNKYKDEKEDAVRNLTKLQSEYTSLEGKYEQNMIDSQLTITDLEAKMKQCCCDKNLTTLSPKKKTADEKIRALKQLCSELKNFENQLRCQNKALVQKNKKLEDAVAEKLAASRTKEFKEINSLKDELLKANATIQEQNRLNNTTKFQKEESENELSLLKSQISVLEDQCRCLTEQLNSAKNRDIDRCDIFTQTEHSLPQDEKTVPSCHQRKYYEIDSDEWARIRKEITFTDPLLSPIRSDSSSDTSIIKSRRRRTARSRGAKMQNKADNEVPNIITPLQESMEKFTLFPEFPKNDSLENKQDNTLAISGAEMNLNKFNSAGDLEHTSIKVDRRLFSNVNYEQMPKNSSIKTSKLLHENVINKSEVDLGGISSGGDDWDKNGQHFNVDNCLFPNNQVSYEEQSIISFEEHANEGHFNVAPPSTPISIESDLMRADANCSDNDTSKDLPSKEDNTSKEYSTISLSGAEKSLPVAYSTDELTNRDHDCPQRDFITATAQKKSKEDSTCRKAKARTNRRRMLWMPYNTNNLLRPRIPKRRQCGTSKKMVGKGDTILNALQTLKRNNISFTISSDSMQPTFPNFAVQPTTETSSQSQSHSRTFSCATVCWNKKCMKDGMRLRKVHQNEEPELLGFFDIKHDPASSSSISAKTIKEQPLKTVKQLAQQLLIAFKEINSAQKRPTKKCFKPRRNTCSEFKSGTESELERLVDTPDILQRNKRMLEAARRQSFMLNKEIGRESDIDGLFDSGLVTATTKHDTDSQSFLSYNEDCTSNAFFRNECNALPDSSKEIMDLMLLTPSKMTKLLSPLSSSVKSYLEDKSKQDPLSTSRTLVARRLVQCPVSSKIEPVNKTVASLSGISEQSCVSFPELSINTQDLNCSVDEICISQLERNSSVLDASIDKSQRVDRLVGKNQRESKRRPKTISETKVDSIETESPITRIIQLRNKSIRVKSKIDDIKMLEKQYRQSLWKGSSESDSDRDNVRSVSSRKKNQSVSESENSELFAENLEQPFQLKQCDSASLKRTKVLREAKAKSKRSMRSSRKIVSREIVSEADTDCSLNEERVKSRISVVEDRLKDEAKQESETKAQYGSNLPELRRSKRYKGQSTFRRMLGDANKNLANSSQPWKTNVQFRNRMESLGGDSLSQLSRSTPASLKKKWDKKQLFGSETDSSCADTSSVDCEFESVVKNEPKNSKESSAEINHQIEIKDHLKQEVSCQINIPDAENEIFDDFNSMVQDESFQKAAWFDNIQIEKDQIEDSTELKRSSQKNFDDFKTRYRAKYLESKQLSNELIIDRPSCEEDSKTMFSWDVTNDQIENSRSHGVVESRLFSCPSGHYLNQAVCDTSSYSQSKIYRNTEDVKEDKKINIVENIIVTKGILSVLPTSSYGGECSRSDTTDQNIISHPLLGSNVKLETGESSKNTNYNWKDISHGLAVDVQASNIDVQTPKSDKSNLLPDSPASPDLVENMEPTSKQLSRGEILDTMNKLILLSKDANVFEEVVHMFSDQTVDYVARIILDKLCQDIFDKPDNDYPPSPLMTTTQRILLGFLTKLDDSTHKGITDEFLDIAELRLFKTCNANIIEPVTRVYTAICRMRVNISRIRRFICESFYFADKYAISILFIVLTMWGNILPMASNLTEYPLTKVIVQLCYTTTQTSGHIVHLRDLLQKYFGYPSEHWNPDELFEELLDQYIKDPFKRQYDFALLLFLKSRPAKWVFQKIKDHLMMLYQRIPPGNSNLKANLLIFMGNICHSFKAHIEEEWHLIVEMNQWFETLQNVEDDLLVQKSIILAKCRLPEKRLKPVKKKSKSCKGRKTNQSSKDESSTILELNADSS